LDEFVADPPQSSSSTNAVKSLDDLLLPMDFHEVLNHQNAQSTSQGFQK
jgi:hypothetical protein